MTTAAASGTAMLLAPSWLQASADPIDPHLSQVLARTIGIDMHNHVYPTGTEPHMQHGQQQEAQPPALSIAAEIKRSGLTAVCAAFVLDFAQNNKPGDARDNYLRWLTAVDTQLAQDHIHRALNLHDLQSAHADGRPTIVQSVEGAMFIEGRLERIQEVYNRGLRHLQLLHMKDDLVSPLGDVITAPAHLGGLTPFGVEVIKECNRLGILVDMAHATAETVQGALKASDKPILISHTGLDSRPGSNPKMAEMMRPHLISKERAKVVADAGGVVGVWTKLADTPKAFVENIKAMIDVIGIDHVGIGTDSDLLSARPTQGTNANFPGPAQGFFYTVVSEMLNQKFSTDEIVKVGGGNFCRIFGQATSVHA